MGAHLTGVFDRVIQHLKLQKFLQRRQEKLIHSHFCIGNLCDDFLAFGCVSSTIVAPRTQLVIKYSDVLQSISRQFVAL